MAVLVAALGAACAGGPETLPTAGAGEDGGAGDGGPAEGGAPDARPGDGAQEAGVAADGAGVPALPGALIALAPEELELAARRLEVQRALERGELDPPGVLSAAGRLEAQPLAPRPLAAPHQALLRALDAVAGRCAERDPERAAALAFEAAQLLAGHAELDEARARAEGALARGRAPSLRRAALELLLEIHLARSDWERVEVACRALAAESPDPDRRAALARQARGARRRFAEELGALGRRLWERGERDAGGERLLVAAEALVALAVAWPAAVTPGEEPRAAAAPAMLLQAAEGYALADALAEAGRVAERLVAEFPASPQADRALFLAGQAAFARADFPAAADLWRALVDGHPGSELRAEALLKAAVAFERAGLVPQAAEAYERWAGLFPARPEAAETFQRAGEALERAGAWAAAAESHRRFVRAFGLDAAQGERVLWALYRIAEAHRALGQPGEARVGYLAVLKLARGLQLTAGGLGARAAAEAEARLAAPR